MLDLGKVVGVHRESQKIDVVMLSTGKPLPGVKVMAGTASGNTGFSDIPVPDVNDASNPYYSSNTGGRDMFAVVAYFMGAPVAIGFLYPETSEMLFPDPNRMVYRHASDAYFTIDDAGNTEFAHPSGLYMRVGQSPAHEDLTGKDYNGRFAIRRNTAPNVHFHLQMGGNVMSLDVAPSGDIVIHTTATATVKADQSVTVDSPQSTFTGAVTVEGPFTFQSGANGKPGEGGGAAITLVGDVSITGSGHITGSFSSDTDFVSAGKSGATHTHPTPSGQSGEPS